TSITGQGLDIDTTGKKVTGVMLEGHGSTSDGRSDTTVALRDSQITTNGEEAKGVLVSGDDGNREGKTEFTGKNLTITTKGKSSPGVRVENAGSANLLDSSITTEKARSYALHAKNGGAIEAHKLNAETHGSGKFSHSVYAES